MLPPCLTDLSQPARVPEAAADHGYPLNMNRMVPVLSPSHADLAQSKLYVGEASLRNVGHHAGHTTYVIECVSKGDQISQKSVKEKKKA
jgi:hypothetical protein